MWYGQNPLTNWCVRKDVVHEVSGSVAHRPSNARRTETATLARKRRGGDSRQGRRRASKSREPRYRSEGRPRFLRSSTGVGRPTVGSIQTAREKSASRPAEFYRGSSVRAGGARRSRPGRRWCCSGRSSCSHTLSPRQTRLAVCCRYWTRPSASRGPRSEGSRTHPPSGIRCNPPAEIRPGFEAATSARAVASETRSGQVRWALWAFGRTRTFGPLESPFRPWPCCFGHGLRCARPRASTDK